MSAHLKWLLFSGAFVLFSVCGCGDSAAPQAEEISEASYPVEPEIDAEPSNEHVPGEANATATSESPGEPATAEPVPVESIGSAIIDEMPLVEDVYPDPVQVLTATELATASKDKDTYKNTYVRKQVEVSGIVHGYDNKGWGSEVRVALETNVEFENIFTDNKVLVEIKEETPWARYLPGSKLTLRGIVKSGLKIGGGFASSHSAIVVNSEPGEPLPEFEAAEFVKLHDKDAIRKSWLILKGSVTAVEVEPGDENTLGVKHIYLGSGTEKQLHLNMPITNNSYQHRHTRNLKRGDTVKVLAKYDSTDELPLFTEVFLIDPLPELPALPTTVLRPVRFSGDEPHLYFTADLLGEWMDDPRALDHMLGRREHTLCELHGEIADVRPSELDETDMYVLFKNASSNDVRYVLKKKSSELDKLKPGATVSVRGTLDVAFAREEYAFVGK